MTHLSADPKGTQKFFNPLHATPAQPSAPNRATHWGSTVTPHNPGLQTRARDHCLVRKVSGLVSGFHRSRSMHPHPGALPVSSSPLPLLPRACTANGLGCLLGLWRVAGLHPQDTETESWGFPKQQP